MIRRDSAAKATRWSVTSEKPAIVEAVALNFADNVDAKMETFAEIMENSTDSGWLGYNRLFESNLRRTSVE